MSISSLTRILDSKTQLDNGLANYLNNNVKFYKFVSCGMNYENKRRVLEIYTDKGAYQVIDELEYKGLKIRLIGYKALPLDARLRHEVLRRVFEYIDKFNHIMMDIC